MTATDAVEVVKALAWPFVVGASLIIFRGILTQFTMALGKRAAKLENL